MTAGGGFPRNTGAFRVDLHDAPSKRTVALPPPLAPPSPPPLSRPRRSDLKIGGMLNVYNRQLLLHDCDAFTKQFYCEQRGRTEAEFRPVLMECKHPSRPPRHHSQPVYSGNS